MDQVSQVRDRTDIVTLISEHNVQLKKTGSNFKGLCPFHGEKTPSFVVSPERQIWHCFGCGKGGDCFTYLMEYENIDFAEALRLLAKQAGIELSSSPLQQAASSKREKLYALNMLAAEYYQYVLTKHAVGKQALTYVTQTRGIHEKVLNTFMVGFSPASGKALSNYLMKKKGYTKEDLLDAGLISIRNGSVYDFFNNRLMFPLFDHRENVIGFAGRLLDDTKNQNGFSPKYVNTRETLIYHKGEVFFGLHIAKKAIKEEGRAIIMEGEFDVLSSFQEGVSNCVAVKGTALTQQQVGLIARFATKVSLCFDQDKAGKEAIKRSLLVLEERGITTSVIVLPDAKDPDELIKQDPVAYKQAVKQAKQVYDYLIEEALKTFDRTTADGKQQIVADVLPLINLIENEIVKEHYLRKLSQELDTSFESMQRQSQKIRQLQKKVVQPEPKKEQKERTAVLEEYITAFFVQQKISLAIMKQIKILLQPIPFERPAFQKLLSLFFTQLPFHGTIDKESIVKQLPTELLPAFDTTFLYPLPVKEKQSLYDIEALKSAKELRILRLRKQMQELSNTIGRVEKDGNTQELDTLTQAFSEAARLLQETERPLVK